MKKIIFEQVGNIVLLCLFVAGLVQAVGSSRVNANLFEIKFGIWFDIFIVASFLFFLAQKYFSHRWRGYDLKKGEFSAEDEREELISEQASVKSYKAVLLALTCVLCGFFFFSTISDDLKLLKIIGIIGFGGCILVGFITYLISWMILDRK